MEDLRWSESGVVCPHCGSLAKHYFLKPRDPEGRKTRTGARSNRRVWKCKDCRKQFSVLTGTIFHGTKIPLQTWLFVVFEMCASKNGVAAREIERKYDVTPKSAWVSLVNTTTGEVRSHVVRDVTGTTLGPILRTETDLANSVLHTDKSHSYRKVGKEFADHQYVDHFRGEYVRGEVSTNAAEGYFSQLKRSLDGTHHAVSREHLHRYLAEFDFRYSTRKMNDSLRMRMVMGRTGGRRLSYRPLTES